MHVVLRCDGPATSWPLKAFAVVAVTGVLATTWRTVVGEPISGTATSGPDEWTVLPGPAHRGRGVLDCASAPSGERAVVFVPGAPPASTASASGHPDHGAWADRDWSRHARVRVVATVDRYSPAACGYRFEAGEVLAMRQNGSPGPVPRADAMLAYVTVTRAMEVLDHGGLSWIHDRAKRPRAGRHGHRRVPGPLDPAHPDWRDPYRS
ncbi:hypothetical protein SAMN05421803_14611 [Nocardiopsis flavescens]|uniref:Uncharacterized protein n=1 Tax=Nocardiopsis flavescens TaxID=758803 RepID=A0A1M6WLY7_9ACTN|nr:hypothetical protein [Nocardiopsis flavescens]SHK94599.1 hypothetical protein SAMN05421803_14611 [Nocardiopsis flavescens]